MSWFKNSAPSPRTCSGMTLALGCAALLTACGFTPMYAAPKTRAGVESVRIANIPDYAGQYLRNALIDRLPPSDAPRYELRIAPLIITIDNRAIRKDATSTRGDMRIATTLQIVDLTTGKTLLNRPLESAGGFNQLDNRFATLTSREDLTHRLLDEMADNARMAFALALQGTADAP